MPTIDITAENFEQTLTSNEIVLVDFWAEWCGPCKQFAPIFDKTSEAHPDVTFAKVDTEAEQQLATEAGIQAIPTLMAFREGVLVFNQAGALPEKSLDELINSVRGLNMDNVKAQVAQQQARHAEGK